MPDAYPYNVPVSFHFEISFTENTGIGESLFQEASGLNMKLETEPLVIGGRNQESYKLPKKVTYDNLVLKRGLLKNSGLITWVNDALVNFSFVTRLIKVSLLDAANSAVVEWSLRDAYPVGLRISDFKSTDNSVVVETLELAYSSFTRTDYPG